MNRKIGTTNPIPDGVQMFTIIMFLSPLFLAFILQSSCSGPLLSSISRIGLPGPMLRGLLLGLGCGRLLVKVSAHTNLPAHRLHEIFDRVPCAADRHRAYLACTAWLTNAVAEADWPPALPCLLLPAPGRYGASATRVVCALSGYRVHHHHGLPFITPGARFSGSHEGAWLFVHNSQTNSHELVNLRTGNVHGLPGGIRLDINIGSRHLYLYSAKTIIHAAALSSSPDSATCTAVSIVTAVLAPAPPFRFVAIWRKGWPYVVEIRPPDVRISYFYAEDVIYHDGAFHLLHARGDEIRVCTPVLAQDQLRRIDWENRRFFYPGGRVSDNSVRSRYLVSSRGELLLVVRFEPPPHEPTSKFKVFRATERPPQMPEAYPCFPVAAYPWAWSDLDTLDGRIMFVGHGCSRSYDVNDPQGRIQYKGFKAGIYFLDDRKCCFLDAVQYTCSDNGRWSESDGRVQLCFPPADPLWNSPPAWLLP